MAGSVGVNGLAHSDFSFSLAFALASFSAFSLASFSVLLRYRDPQAARNDSPRFSPSPMQHALFRRITAIHQVSDHNALARADLASLLGVGIVK